MLLKNVSKVAPTQANAQLGVAPGIGLPFGGYVIFSIPCTCSAGLAVFMAPFFPGVGNGVPVPFGALLYQPGISKLFAYYNIGVPTTWHLGNYTPGGACLIGVPPACVPIPVVGIMTQVGTSIPGAIPY